MTRAVTIGRNMDSDDRFNKIIYQFTRSMEEAQRRVDDWREKGDPGKDLYLSGLSLTALPALPRSLKVLHCYDNQLQTIPDLPRDLEALYCSDNQLQALPALPSSLKHFNCSYNQLRTLPILPRSLGELGCSGNQLQTLPALPSSLQWLYCLDNQLQTLPALPSSLETLYCLDNQLQTLPALPSSLEYFNCEGNPLPFFSLADWKRLSNLRRSIHLRAFQRHCRRKLIRKRTRPKDLLNYSIYGRPGLGVGWFEFCLEADLDPRRYDRKKYGLRRQVQ